MKQVRCSELEQALLSGNELTEPERRHLAGCRSCRELQQIDARLSQLGRWHRRLDGERLPALQPPAARAAQRLWRPVAVAAGLLVLAGVGYWWWTASNQRPQPEQRVAEQLFALLDDVDQVTQPLVPAETDDQDSDLLYPFAADADFEQETLPLPRSLQALELIIGEVTL